MPVSLALELTAVLTAEAQEFARLLPLLEEEREQLLHPHPPALLALLGNQERLVARIVKLEAQRLGLLTRLAAVLGIDPAEVTFGRLAGLLPELPPRLARVGAELAELLPRVAAANTDNAFLADTSLAYVEALVRRFIGAITPPAMPTYGRRGCALAGAVSASLLDREA